MGVTMAAKIVAVVVTLASLAAAEPGYGYGGVAYHPYGGSSYTHRSPQGLHGHYGGYGKRSAEAEPGYGGVAYHPYGGSSSVYRTTQGLTGYGYGGYGGYGHGYGKRSAEPGYGYGHATSYYHRSPQGLHGHYGGYGYGGYGHGYGKRSADAGYYGYGGYGHGAGSYQQVSRPYFNYGVSVAHPY